MRFFNVPRWQLLAFAVWCLGWAVVSAALLAPIDVPAPGRSDVLVHGMLFAAMALAAVSFCPRPGRLVLAALFTLGAGIALEFAQGLVPYRHFDGLDAIANATGSVLGFAGALVILYLARPQTTAPSEARVSS
jgi:hypothetical protein